MKLVLVLVLGSMVYGLGLGLVLVSAFVKTETKTESVCRPKIIIVSMCKQRIRQLSCYVLVMRCWLIVDDMCSGSIICSIAIA